MANVKVEFIAKVAQDVKEVYLVGSDEKIGSWDPKNAIKMNNKEKGVFTISKMFEAGDEIEFKFLSSKSYSNVEKGLYLEEIENHKVTAKSGVKKVIVVKNFAC